METQITNVVQAFPNAKQYAIPSYQRNYVWTREGQWEPLWEDVKALANRSVKEDQEVKPHFLGTIITKQIGARRFINRWWVVDGQQRLTTLQILLNAARAAFQERGLNRFADLLADCLANSKAMVTEPADRYKIDPKSGDYSTFASIIDANGSAHEASTVGSGLEGCHAYFLGSVREWLDTPTESGIERFAEALALAIREKLHVVDIRLGEGDNPHTIFEALNARGEPLTEWEKTKNYILSIATGPGDPDGDSTYQAHLEQYDSDPYWNQVVNLQRFTGKRIDLFLSCFAQIELPGRRRTISGDARLQPLSRDGLYREFRYVGEHGYRRDRKALEGMLKRLDRYADIYRRIDSQTGFSTYALEVMRRRHVLSLNSLVPVFMVLVSRLGTGKDLDAVLRIVDSYLMRRVALKAHYSGFDRIAFGHVQAVRDARDGEVGTVLLRRLLNSPGRERWPRDEEIVQHLVNGDSYQRVSSERLKLLLGAIAQQMHDERVSRLAGSFGLASSVTVEHVAPQSWQRHWQDDLGVGISEEDRWRIDQIVHRIGNLTLVTQPMNSSLGANPWSFKAELLEKDNLEMNRRLLSDMDGDVWNEREIDRRSRQIAEYVCKIWPDADVLATILRLDVTVPDPAVPSEDNLTPRLRNAQLYGRFWKHFARRYPEDGTHEEYLGSNQWITIGSGNPDISLAFAADAVGVFFTRWARAKGGEQPWLRSRRAIIDKQVGVGRHASVWKAYDTHNPDNWDEMCDWLHDWLERFVKIVDAEPTGGHVHIP